MPLPVCCKRSYPDHTLYSLMKKNILGLICFAALIPVFETLGQGAAESRVNDQDSTEIFMEISSLVSTTGKVPFWLQANQFGIAPTHAPSFGIHGLVKQYWPVPFSENKNWRWGATAEIVANVNAKSGFLFPQLHGSLRYKNWELFIGRKKQWIGLADSTLGSGSYSWSTNALPIPKIQIGTTRFVDVPGTKGWVSFLGFYSEGVFESKRPITRNLKLHQKMLYLRVGRASSRLKLYGGFNHQVQWGGTSPYQTLNGKMPRGLKNYFRVVTGKPGDASEVVNEFDNGNRVGNHLGTIDLAMEVETYNHSFFLYRQNIYEDGTLYALTNIEDGLNGLRIKRKNTYGATIEITEAIFEFLFTKSQGGGEFDFGDHAIKRGDFGRDNYFNNAQIRDGWSYDNRTIGTPFITPSSATEAKWGRYGDSFTSNNRVSVLHMGLKGLFLGSINWYTKLSYSTNIGTYDLPFAKTVKQFSGILSLQYHTRFLGGVLCRGSVGVDLGELYRPVTGINLGVRKIFSGNIN
jgi:hypothetical protein